MWAGVPPEHVLSFLGLFSTHQDAARANASVLAKYIRQQVQRGELTDWTVLLVGGDGADRATFGSWFVNCVVRQPKGGYGDPTNPRVIQAGERFVIRRLLNPRDEAVDLGRDAYDAATAATQSNPPKRRRSTDQPPRSPSGVYLRKQRSARHGLLLLYPLARRQGIPHEGQTIDHVFLPVEPAPIGLGISFPDTDNAESVSYVVNSIYSDTDDDGDA